MGHCVEVICVILVVSSAATLAEEVNEAVNVVKNEDVDESVRATEAVIVPAVEPAACMI